MEHFCIIDLWYFMYIMRSIPCLCSYYNNCSASFLAECDIEYISPSDYDPPELRDNSFKNGGTNQEDDPYERLVRGSLKAIDKQKVL